MMALLMVLLQGPDSLTAQAAVDRALTARGQVRVAAAGVSRARAAVRLGGQIPNPTATLSHTDDTPRRHVAVQQSFDWLLFRGSSVSAAQSSLQAALADSSTTVAEIAAATRSAFYRARAAEEALALLAGQALISDSLTAIARERLRNGDISELEADQLGLEASRTRQALSRGREDRAAALAQLRRLTAWPDTDSLPPLSGRLDDGLDQSPIPALDEAQIPSVRSRLADSAAARLRRQVAVRGRFPLPALEVGIDWDDPTLTPPGKKLWLVGVSFPLPLWNLSGAQVASAQADVDEATALLAEARAELRGRMAETRIRMEETRFRARVDLDSLLPAAQRIRERTARGYQLGETGVVPLLDALRSEREIVLSLVEDLMAFQEARATWSSLLGVTQ